MQSVLAFTVAALGALYNKASSPNESPGPYVLTSFSFSSFDYILTIIKLTNFL